MTIAYDIARNSNVTEFNSSLHFFEDPVDYSQAQSAMCTFKFDSPSNETLDRGNRNVFQGLRFEQQTHTNTTYTSLIFNVFYTLLVLTLNKKMIYIIVPHGRETDIR